MNFFSVHIQEIWLLLQIEHPYKMGSWKSSSDLQIQLHQIYKFKFFTRSWKYFVLDTWVMKSIMKLVCGHVCVLMFFIRYENRHQNKELK